MTLEDVKNSCGSRLGLKSANKECIGEEPEVTTYVEHFSGTLDYLFAGATVVRRVRSVLSVPSIEELEKEGAGIPSSSHPSDHLPIGIELDLSL